MMQSKQSGRASADDAAAESEGSGEFVRALAKGLAVIECFDSQAPAMTLTDVAKRVGLSRGTSRRLLHTLVELGYVGFDGKLFSLKPRVLNLGFAYLYSHNVWQMAQPYLVDVVEKLHESCSIAVLDGSEIVYVARVPTSERIMSINLGLGTRLPAHATSMGRVLLAGQSEVEQKRFIDSISPLPQYTAKSIVERSALLRELQQVRKQGWALVDQELELGLRSLAVPIHDANRCVIAALNVGTQASRWTVSALTKDALPVLKGAAQQVSALFAPGRGR